MATVIYVKSFGRVGHIRGPARSEEEDHGYGMFCPDLERHYVANVGAFFTVFRANSLAYKRSAPTSPIL